MGRWIRGRWICVWGAPDLLAPNRLETLRNKGFGASGLKTRGTPKAQIQRPWIQHPILGPLSYTCLQGSYGG